MLKMVLILVFLVIAGILAFATTKPDTFRVERSIIINAPSEKIYPLISNFHQWQIWSPYEKMDPNMKRAFEGPESGKGAVYSWNGAGKVGQGRMEILETQPASKVIIKLHFVKPFEATNTTEFTIIPEGKQTKVTWAMSGIQPFMGKVISVFFNLDPMIGKDFEDGLQNLKKAVEP
ncbi:MAG: SRPBCC family protein [Vampirovibrionales bacterium]|nr:SRPBCC family protein [Vampirovibrionales bacterium]